MILTACLFFTILISDGCFALRINEFEPNPAGKDAGFEWVEIYSETSVNLEGYILQNGDNEIYNLSGIFSGYITIIFPGAWLDNSNESVFLKHGAEIIDQAIAFNDATNDDKTWSFCSDWKFISGTQNAVNSCEGATQIIAQEKNETEEDSELRYLTNNDLNNFQNPVTNSSKNLSKAIFNTIKIHNDKPEKIVLNKFEKEDEKTIVTKSYRTRVGVIYAFLVICVLLVVLMALRKL